MSLGGILGQKQEVNSLPFVGDHYDAEGYKIKNVGDPVDEQDVVNLRSLNNNFFMGFKTVTLEPMVADKNNQTSPGILLPGSINYRHLIGMYHTIEFSSNFAVSYGTYFFAIRQTNKPSAGSNINQIEIHYGTTTLCNGKKYYGLDFFNRTDEDAREFIIYGTQYLHFLRDDNNYFTLAIGDTSTSQTAQITNGTVTCYITLILTE